MKPPLLTAPIGSPARIRQRLAVVEYHLEEVRASPPLVSQDMRVALIAEVQAGRAIGPLLAEWRARINTWATHGADVLNLTSSALAQFRALEAAEAAGTLADLLGSRRKVQV